jgi:hypothetical protein
MRVSVDIPASIATISNLRYDGSMGPSNPQGFIYLVQAENSRKAYYWAALTASLSRQLVLLCWAERCDDYRSPLATVVFSPSTSWSVGRNKLFEVALQLPQQFLYYTILDEDATLSCVEHFSIHDPGECLLLYEQFLLTYRPPVGHPSFVMNGLGYVSSPSVAERSLHFDGLLNSIHIDAVPWLYPLDLTYEDTSWWVSQGIVILRALCFKGYVLRHNWVVANNAEHRPYPRSHYESPMETARRHVLNNSYMLPVDVKSELAILGINSYDVYPGSPPRLPYPGIEPCQTKVVF